MILAPSLAAASAIHWSSLGLSPVALDLHYIQIRWYSFAYIFGIILGWWYVMRMLRQPGAPMAVRHADDLVFYATLGILIGGRLGYILFYQLREYLNHPIEIFKLWHGGMSFHGGAIGVALAILYLTRRNKLSVLRVGDYIACVAPIGLFLGRLANFVNGELWGRVTDVPWGMIFPGAPGGLPRHPSQLYEAGLEGIGLFLVLNWLFWRTKARYQPGKLTGTFLLGYGLIRVFLENFREPDEQLGFILGPLTMGQLLSLPMILFGVWLIVTARGRQLQPGAANAGGSTVA
jgi:phosphatidylglycerol:prolipoprotein diacylglycerol transferase